eukprot:3940542-Rhodomonas_salina.1
MELIAEALSTVWESSIPTQPSGDVPDPDRQKNAVWAATAAHMLMVLAAGNSMHLHSLQVDITQAFIQASWADLPEEIGDIYITPQKGYNEDPDVVYRVVLQLYCIRVSAQALHYTLTHWFRDNGFEQASFEESVWIRDPDERYPSLIIVSTHIDDMLCACDDL